MKKADKLRSLLRGSGTGLSNKEIAEGLGIAGAQVGSVMNAFRRSGEVIVDKTEEGNLYRLNPDFKAGIDKTLPVKRKKKARKTTRKPRQVKTLRQIAERIAQRPALGKLALDQLIAASSLLRTTIEQQVDGLNTNPILVGALQNAERAERLAEVA